MKYIHVYQLEDIEKQTLIEPYIIVGKPCEKLFLLQKDGYCVVAELSWLKDHGDEEISQMLCEEEAVTRYKNVCIDVSKLTQAYWRRVWCRHKKIPVVIAETEHLLIRESISADAAAFCELYQDALCQKYLEPIPVEVNSVYGYERYINQYKEGQYAFYEYGMWSVVEKESSLCVGRAGLECILDDTAEEDRITLGYALLAQYRGKGYAQEACEAILAYCAECEYAEEVYVRISEDNHASFEVYKKLQKNYPIKLI